MTDERQTEKPRMDDLELNRVTLRELSEEDAQQIEGRRLDSTSVCPEAALSRSTACG